MWIETQWTRWTSGVVGEREDIKKEKRGGADLLLDCNFSKLFAYLSNFLELLLVFRSATPVFNLLLQKGGVRLVSGCYHCVDKDRIELLSVFY